MGPLTKVIILAGVALLAVPAVSQAAERTVVPCWAGYGGEWDVRERVEPRNCWFNGGASHAESTPLKGMRYRSWGGPTACGRATYVYNQGYRAPVKFCLYARRHYYENTWDYNRIRVRFLGRESWIENGRRVWHKRKPFSDTNRTW